MAEKSPYAIFKEWLFDGDMRSEIPEICLSVINKRTALSMLGRAGNVTIFVDKYFNNYEMMKLDDAEFFKFMKELVVTKEFGKYDFSFFKSASPDKDLKELRKKLFFLKLYEIELLLEVAKNDDEFDAFEEALGITKYKKTAIKQRKKGKTKSKDTELISEISSKEMNENKLTITDLDKSTMRSYSFSQWLDAFGQKQKSKDGIYFQSEEEIK